MHQRTCSSLKCEENVVYLLYSEIHKRKIHDCGTVLWVDTERKYVVVHWLHGYKDGTDNIPFEDMVAVYNPDGEYIKWKGVEGKSDLLTPV